MTAPSAVQDKPASVHDGVSMIHLATRAIPRRVADASVAPSAGAENGGTPGVSKVFAVFCYRLQSTAF